MNCVCATSLTQLQAIQDTFAHAYENLGRSTNVKKTDVFYQPLPGQHPTSSSLSIRGSKLKKVQSFPYYGSVLPIKADIDAEILHHLKAALESVCREGVKNHTTILVYKAVVYLHSFMARIPARRTDDTSNAWKSTTSGISAAF